MAYLLPRLLVLALLWALTCALIAVMGPLTATACYLAAVCWGLLGIGYSIHVRRVRLESGAGLLLRTSGVFDSEHLD